jgi:hypothetical protein
MRWFILKFRFSRARLGLCDYSRGIFHTAFSLLYSATCAKVTSPCERNGIAWKLTGNHAPSHPTRLVGASFPQSSIPINCLAPGPRLQTEVARISPQSLSLSDRKVPGGYFLVTAQRSSPSIACRQGLSHIIRPQPSTFRPKFSNFLAVDVIFVPSGGLNASIRAVSRPMTGLRLSMEIFDPLSRPFADPDLHPIIDLL